MASNTNFYKIVSQDLDLILDLEQARQHLFIYDDTSSDDLIEQYIATAQELVEDWINQPLTPTQINAYYNQLDPSGLIAPHPYITNVSLFYMDTNAMVQEVPVANWAIDATNALPRIYAPSGSYFAPGAGANVVNVSITNPVYLSYTAQLEEIANQQSRTFDRVRQAMLLYLSDLWNNRADESDARIALTTITTARRMLKKYRLPTL